MLNVEPTPARAKLDAGSAPAVPTNPTRTKLDPISAPALADLMLAAAARARSHAVTLRRTPRAATVFAVTSDVANGCLHVPTETAIAAAARLALAAGLDPLLEPGTPASQCGIVHVLLEPEGCNAEVVVTTSATPTAWELTVKPVGGPHAGSGGEERTGAIGPIVADEPRPGGNIGPYKVLAAIGEGGMGLVFEAEHALIGRRVAIKVLRRSLAQNPVAMRRFLAEARAANRLVHPNVVAVTDYGILVDGRPFVVMERLQGESLDARLDREAAIEPATALRIAHEIALALDAVHQAGVQHNDLKPANVLLLTDSTDDAPRLKLLDFGAALTQDAAAGDDVVVGTPEFMAPERARGGVGDARSDLYALGATLYEMLTGAPPFSDATPTAVLCAQIARPLPRMVSPRYEIPSAVEALVTRALAKDPGNRPADAREMLFEIETALATCSRRGWRRLLP